MANPSNISLFLRLVGGNAANEWHTLDADNDESKISAHTFIAALEMWSNTEITKQNIIDRYNLTHSNDDNDLTLMKQWYDAANNKEKFVQIFENRIILSRSKKDAAGIVNHNGAFNYALKDILINGADGIHSLENTGPVEEQFNSWA